MMTDRNSYGTSIVNIASNQSEQENVLEPEFGQASSNDSNTINNNDDGADIGEHETVLKLSKVELQVIEPMDTDKEHHFTHHEFGHVKIFYLNDNGDHVDDTDSSNNGDNDNNGRSHRHRPRQFFIGDVLYRERNARRVSWDELFLDLLFVSVTQKLSHIVELGASHDYKSKYVSPITWWNIVDFFLVLVPVVSAWYNITSYLNRFGQQGIADRLGLYLVMILIFGMGLNAENVFNQNPDKNSANIFIITFLILRVLHCGAVIAQGVINPEFLRYLTFTTLLPQISLVPYFVSLFIPITVPNGMTIMRSLYFAGYLLDVAFYIAGMALSMSLKRHFIYRVALNIEHWVERMGLFIIVIFGELIFAIIPSSEFPTFSYLYLDSILGFFIVASLQWMYFYLIDGYSGRFTHPLRYKPLNGIVWTLCHLWLSAFLIILGAGIGIMVKHDPKIYNPTAFGLTELEQSELGHAGYGAVRWLVSGGYAASMFVLTLMGALYHCRDADAKVKQFDRYSVHNVLFRIQNRFRRPQLTRRVSSRLQQSDESTSDQNAAQDIELALNNHEPLQSRNRDQNYDQKLPDQLPKLPRCLLPKRYHHEDDVILIPRFTKGLRLSIRFFAGLCAIIVDLCSNDYMPVSVFLGIIAVVAVTAVFLEEVGKRKIEVSKSKLPNIVDREPRCIEKNQ
ncbi:hypothetical protein MP228_006921 [Amoeboaphelidium protococcarum]|nr:hypothetical protein MP228_006921 [Amoeboaphelidium protococcarum]